ncbi:MAG: TetR/AcrR family transcriptional regulator [Nitrospirae bacterium]|nr:TetR/AcrR family transcriptional regulator [Nitrospirota bacterium]
MRKKQEHSPAKEKLLDAAQRLMLAKGYEATSVEEICSATGLTKGSFFHYFGSKEDLGKAALDRHVSARFQTFQEAPFMKKTDPLQRIYGYVDFIAEMNRNPEGQIGCLLGVFSQELSDTRPGIRSQCARQFAQWAEALKQDLDMAKEKYRPRTSVNARELAEHLIAVIEGSLILAKANQDREIVGRNLRHFKQYLKSIFERG